MSKKNKKGGIWGYLEACGVLEKGTEDDIKTAKKTYRKIYLKNYRKNQRKENPEYTVRLSKSKGDYHKIINAAKKHKMPVSAFISISALSYINQTYIYPDRLILAELKQLLSNCLNEIQIIVKQKERYFWGKEQKFKDIEKRIEKLELEINNKLTQPYLLEELIIKEIEKRPELKVRLLNFLNQYDYQNQIT